MAYLPHICTCGLCDVVLLRCVGLCEDLCHVSHTHLVCQTASNLVNGLRRLSWHKSVSGVQHDSVGCAVLKLLPCAGAHVLLLLGV